MTKYLSLLLLFSSLVVSAQYNFSASKKVPYGKANPDAPKQIKDYESLIGVSNCKSSTKNQDGTWSEGVDMIWTWKYILNGMAIQDETLKADGTHSGSIRQFIADSSKWYVHWFSSKSPSTIFPV